MSTLEVAELIGLVLAGSGITLMVTTGGVLLWQDRTPSPRHPNSHREPRHGRHDPWT